MASALAWNAAAHAGVGGVNPGMIVQPSSGPVLHQPPNYVPPNSPPYPIFQSSDVPYVRSPTGSS